ncbi:MAG: ribosome maturation factor RimP [Clostridia bacterium]|nr:ribosome maturation factor RimP [Clostridia bacterium]
MKFKSTQEILNAVSSAVELLGVEIVEVEPKISKNPTLTFYIDKDMEGGIDLDTLEAFHNAIDPLLDDADVSNGAAYTLNVSSPGLDRPFKTPRDFLKNLEKEVEVKLFAPLKGQKFFEGILKEYTENYIILETNGQELKLTHNMIAKINKAIKFD